jgi:hypothetical protein
MQSLVLALVFLGVVFVGSAGADDWTTRQDGRFGFSYSYPADLFGEIEGERPSFHYFQSPGTQAKFLVGAWDNERGETPSEFKQWMLTHAWLSGHNLRATWAVLVRIERPPRANLL